MSCNFKGHRKYGYSTCNSKIYRQGRNDGIVDTMHAARFCDGHFRDCPYYNYDNFYDDGVHNNARHEVQDEWRKTERTAGIGLFIYGIIILVILYYVYQFFTYGYIELPF